MAKAAVNKLNRLILDSHISNRADVYIDKDGVVRKNKYPSEITVGKEYSPHDVPAIWDILKKSVRIPIVIGPYNSGKSSAIMQAILRDVMTIPACDSGVRKSKWAFIRNTAGDLETTTLQTWLFWANKVLPPPVRSKKPILTYTYKFRDTKGRVELTCVFLGLDREDDFNKLASLELTGAYINELQFIPRLIFTTLQDRIGRFPAKGEFLGMFEAEYPELKDINFEQPEEKKLYNDTFAEWFPYTRKLYADTNAPETDHWIPLLIEQKDLPAIKVYHQPPGLLQNKNKEWYKNTEADNRINQDPNYYIDMLQHGEEYARVYACGKYGTVVDGKAVFSNYNDDFHSSWDVPINDKEIFWLGADYGILSPALLLSQYVDGQLRVIKEFIGDSLTMKELAKYSLIPHLNKNFRDAVVDGWGDPANTAGGREDLVDLGINIVNALTNDVDKRIKAVKTLCSESVAGKPRLLIDRKGCPKLRDACLGKYHFQRLRIVGKEEFKDKPKKNHPYSDVADCLEYLCLTVTSEDVIRRRQNNTAYEDMKREYAEKTRNPVTGY
jgi:hypothetical protein